MPASGFLCRTDDTWNRFPRGFPALWILLQMCFHSYMLRLPGDKLDEYLLSFSPSFCMIANHAVRLSLLGDSLVFIMHVLSKIIALCRGVPLSRTKIAQSLQKGKSFFPKVSIDYSQRFRWIIPKGPDGFLFTMSR